jgi:hypothetical protein
VGMIIYKKISETKLVKIQSINVETDVSTNCMAYAESHCTASSLIFCGDDHL